MKERQGDVREGLQTILQALDFYRKRFNGQPHSLVAKSLMSVGKCHEKLGELVEAETVYKGY